MDYRTKSRIRYWLKAGHRKGHGIHSPFLYHLISEVIENDGYFSAYPKIGSAAIFLNKLLKEDGEFPVARLRKTDLDLKFGKLLFRLVNEFLPGQIVSYGSTCGLNLLYLALADSRNKVYNWNTEPGQSEICEKILNRFSVKNVVCKERLLPKQAGFVLLNLPEQPLRNREILANQLQNHGANDVVVIRGIHQSAEMDAVWQELIGREEVRVSLDLYEIGIVLFRTKLQKENFILKF